MSTITELKQQLAAAEATEKEAARTKQMEEAEAMAGRAFYGVTRQRGQTGWYAFRFMKAKRSTWKPDEVEMECRRVWCSIRTGAGNAEIQRATNKEQGYAGLAMINTVEITQGKFNQLWDLAGTVTKAFLAAAGKDMLHVVAEPVDEDNGWGPAGEELVTLDVPVIKLKAGDSNYLPRAFYIQGDQYLLTPLSRIMACNRIDAEDRKLMRGSQFFEACDMHYVNGQQERFARLRRLLNG